MFGSPLSSSEVSSGTNSVGGTQVGFPSYDTLLNTARTVSDYELLVNSPDKAIIPAEQSIRYQLGNSLQLPKRSNWNHSASYNATQANQKLESGVKVSSALGSQYQNSQLGGSDQVMLAKLLSTRFYLPAPLEPIVSNNPYSTLQAYDDPSFTTSSLVTNSPRSLTTSDDLHSSPLKVATEKSTSEVINILQGKKEGSLEALATAY
jgi:hypothetical protein